MSQSYTRSEIDAKLEIVHERANTRQATLDGKLDRIIDSIGNIGRELSEFKADSKQDVALLRREVRDDNKGTRQAIWAVGLGAAALAVALVSLTFAAQGSMTTAVGNTLSAFQAGQTVPKAGK